MSRVLAADPITPPFQRTAASRAARAFRSPEGLRPSMAGHSQFKNIMHKKGRVDAQRSKMFGKLAREVTVAAKLGLPDPDMNPRLRAAILAARAENMPKDNIERAIKKAQGGDAESYDEIRYEGYGPGGAALIVEAMTDNRNRTASDIRSVFTKSGGNLAETGAVAFMFDRVGVVAFDAKAADADDDARGRDRGRRRRRRLEPGRPRGLLRPGRARRGHEGARGALRRAAEIGARLARPEHRRRRRRGGREAHPARRDARGPRRRAERVRELRGLGGRDGEDRWV